MINDTTRLVGIWLWATTIVSGLLAIVLWKLARTP